MKPFKKITDWLASLFGVREEDDLRLFQIAHDNPSKAIGFANGRDG
jgi:hypothetical protein